MKQIRSNSEMPKTEHYAIIIFKTERVFVPGDERSRTAPGHGYPERTDEFDTFEYWVSIDKDDWTKKLGELWAKEPMRKDISAFHVQSVAQPRLTLSIQE